MKLLSIANDPKTVKSQAFGWLTGILYLAPHTLSGVNVCPHASPKCIESCLNSAGHGAFRSVQEARVRKTRWFIADQPAFVAQLVTEITALAKAAAKRGLKPCVRLNGTSDLPWENIRHQGRTLMELFPDVVFYDYSKVPRRVLAYLGGEFPANYHLTFSRSENNEQAVDRVLEAGGNVSVVFRGRIPETWKGRPVIDGDESDLRFLDAKGVVVGLKAKGRARLAAEGFVVNI